MADESFKPVNGDVFLQFFEDTDSGISDEDSYRDVIPALVVDAGPDVVGGVKKGQTVLVYGWARDGVKLTERMVVQYSGCIAAVVAG